jgi:hypothetical protein
VLQVDFGLLQINREGQKGSVPVCALPYFFSKRVKNGGILVLPSIVLDRVPILSRSAGISDEGYEVYQGIIGIIV